MRDWILLAGVLVACSDGAADDDPRADACVKLTCENIGATCGEVPDGCGTMMECGTCAGPATCGGQGVENVCAIPLADRTCVGEWCFEAPAPIPYQPGAMFAVSPTDVWAVGARGAVAHWDGTTWKNVSANTTADLNDIWMASATDGWIVGSGGTLRRWNGTTWATVASGTTANLRGVHGTSPTNVLFVGTGVSRKWNGTALANMTTTTPPDLQDVTVNGNTTWAIGADRIWRLDATQWTSVLGAVDELSGIASAGGAAFAIGRDYAILGEPDELIFRLDGAAWTSVEHPGDPTWTSMFTDGGQIFGASDESIINLANFDRVLGPPGYALSTTGANGARFSATTGGQLWHHDGAWVADGFGTHYDMTAAAVVGDALWFGDASGLVYEWRGGPVPTKLGTSEITGIAATSRDDVWVVDGSRAHHFDGTSWEETNGPPFGTNALVRAGSDLLAVGRYIYRQDEPFWDEEPVPTTNVEYHAATVHGDDVYAVGYNIFNSPKAAHVIKRTNGIWTELPAPNIEALCGIAVVSPDDIWAVGHDGKEFPDVPTGKVTHWNGATWTTVTRPGSQQLCAVLVVNGEVFVGGHDLHRRAVNGTWTVERPLATGVITSLKKVGNELWATGSYGTLLRRRL